jgi:hypothetical protein
VFVGRVCPAAGCKTNFQICLEVIVATAHPKKKLVEFQHTPAGHTRPTPTYTVCGLLKELKFVRITLMALKRINDCRIRSTNNFFLQHLISWLVNETVIYTEKAPY